MKTQSGFFGIYPMAYALFDRAGNLSRPAMRRQIEAMLKHGVHGVAVLGLASEINKLTLVERRTLMEWVAEDVGSGVPLAVTIAESTVTGQQDFIRAAEAAGARWAILQPPPVRNMVESELIRFFGEIAGAATIPLAIQNAPHYLGNGLSNEGLKLLNKAHPNISLVKVETSAVSISKLREETDGAFDVFNGRGGIEITDSIRAGAVGVIPGGESFDVLVRIFEAIVTGEPAKMQIADTLYAQLLPMLVFLMDSMDNFLVYGKAILGKRLGIEEIDTRDPVSPPTTFGLALAYRYAQAVGGL